MIRIFKLAAFVVGSLGAAALAGCGGQDACSDESGTACTWAGKPGRIGIDKPADGVHRLDALLYFPFDLTFAPDGRAYIVDWNNHLIRRVNTDGTLTTVLGTEYEGDGPPDESDRLPEGNPAGALGTVVALNHPTEIRFMPDGTTAVLAAWHNNKLRTLDTTTGIVKVLSGHSYGFAGDGGPASQGLFNTPRSIAIGPDGTIYIADQRNVRIRRIDPAGVLSTIAGTGVKGNTGDGGPALAATLGFDTSTAPWPDGALALRGNELFLADSLNHRIRRIRLDTGIVDCIAGEASVPGYAGDGGSARAAQLNYPNKLEFGPDGRLYVADRMNNAIRAIDVDHDQITTVAGNGKSCIDKTACYTPDEGRPATQIQLNDPDGLAFDRDGNLYVADTLNSRIVRVAK
jgi:DNA-binding beta-propeller fold protein YncE